MLINRILERSHIILLVAGVGFVHSQTLSGKITDSETGESLPGAQVFVKGTFVGTTTDVNGAYSLDVDGSVTVVIAYMGYKTQEVTTSGGATNFVMEPDVSETFIFVQYNEDQLKACERVLLLKENSKIRIVRGITQSPDTEVQIVNKINEIMFDLDIKKMQFEKVYPKTENMLVSSELLKNFNKNKTGVLILGAGNQSDTAFSPKALELARKSKKTVLIVRNHLFSEFHTRSFWSMLVHIMKENKHLYRVYMEILALKFLVRATKRIGRYDEDYFESKS